MVLCLKLAQQGGVLDQVMVLQSVLRHGMMPSKAGYIHIYCVSGVLEDVAFMDIPALAKLKV